MILIDGDPISNIRVLQDQSRILAIMKDGKFHKEPKMNAQSRRLSA
jgi:imidazolonepropionase-like amidohydrolase